MVLLTIYTAVFNASKYIAQTIESIINQTFTDWEYLILDDGSTDNSREIIQNYVNNDKRIRYFYYEHSGNPAFLRNIGIKSGKGKWYANCDHDDIWHPLKLEIQMKFANELDNGGIIFTDKKFFNDPPNELDIDGLYNYLEIKDIVEISAIKVNKINNTTLLYKNYIMNSSTIVSKMVFDKIGLLDEDIKLRGIEDYEFWLRAICNSIEFYQVNEILSFWRVYEGNLSNENRYQKNQEIVNLIKNASKCKNLKIEKKFDFHYNLSYLTLLINKKKFQDKKSFKTIFWFIFSKQKFFIFIVLNKIRIILHIKGEN